MTLKYYYIGIIDIIDKKKKNVPLLLHNYYLLHTYYNLGCGNTFNFCHALCYYYTTYTIMYYGEKSFNLSWSDIFRQKKSFKTKK